MSLEYLVENLITQSSAEITDEIDIHTDDNGYHYMFVKKFVPLKRSLLDARELLAFEDQEYFEIILSIEMDESRNIVYDDHAKLYTTIPTEVFSGCGFNIHAPFRLDSHGKYLLECSFNDYIFQHVAEAVSENLIYRLKSLDIRDIYKILYFERRDVETLDYFYGYLVDVLREREIFYAYTLERYFSLQDIFIANDEELDLFGEMLYEDTKLLISVEKQYESWLIENFDTKRLSGTDIINNIEYIVQRDLFDAKRLGKVYKYLLDCVDLDSEKIADKKILPVFKGDQVTFVSGFEVDVYYLYDDALAFAFDPKLKQKFNLLHEVVTFPDLLNRYESLGIKAYNQRNILLKLKEIFLSTDDEALKIQISTSILNQSKIDEENWGLVKETLMLPASDGRWYLLSEKTIFYPNELLMDMFEGSLFLDVLSFRDCFKGVESTSFLQKAGVWFIPDLREPVSSAHDLYFELCENWQKYRQLLDTKRIDKAFFGALKDAAFIPVEDQLRTIDEVIFVSDGAQTYQESFNHMFVFKNLNYDENRDLIETLKFRHMDHNKVLVTEWILDRFVFSPVLTMDTIDEASKKVLDFIMAFFTKEELAFLKDLEFIAIKESALMRMPLQEMIFMDSEPLYHSLPFALKKSLSFFPIFEKKYVSYFADTGKRLSESLHTSLVHHGIEEQSKKYDFYTPYIAEIVKVDFGIDLKLEPFLFHEVKDLKVKFHIDGAEDIQQRDFFIKNNHCYLDLSWHEDQKTLAKMYQGIFEQISHRKLPAFNYEIEKFLIEGAAFLAEKEMPDELIEKFQTQYNPSYVLCKEKSSFEREADFKKRAIDYFLAQKDISYTESFTHKGYDFVENTGSRKVFCVVKENIDGQYIFNMSQEEISKAEQEGKNYRVYLVKTFNQDQPVYDEVEDIAQLLEDDQILVSKSEYHLIMVQRSEKDA